MPTSWLFAASLLFQPQSAPTFLEADARSIVTELADPKYKGRNSMTEDFANASKFCVDWLKAAGIPAAAKNGEYEQRFTLQRVGVDPTTSSISTKDKKISLVYGTDFVLSAFHTFLREVEAVFVWVPAGKSLTDAQRRSLRDKLVIVHPSQQRDNAAFLQSLAPNTPNPPLSVVRYAETLGNTSLTELVIKDSPLNAPGFRNFRLTKAAAEKLASTYTLPEFFAQSPNAASVETIPTKLVLLANSKIITEFPMHNVVAKIEGSDPKLKNQAVLFGSHLDHLGLSTDGKVHFPGADDNASGVAASLLIARAFKNATIKPKRTIIFSLWTGEETGTFGSLYYSRNPIVNLKDTVAYLNLDMVGRDSDNRPLNDAADDNRDSVYAGIARLNSPDLYKLVKETSQGTNLNLRDDKDDRTARSDTRNFVPYGVPSLKVWTGEHPDYHRPGDTADKLNYAKMVRITQWLYKTADRLANQSGRPAFSEGAEYLQGRWTAPANTVVPPTATATFTLYEVNGARETVVDQITAVRPGAFPIRFALRTDPKKLRKDRSYRVDAVMMDGATKLFSGTAASLTGDNGRLTAVEIVVPG